VQICAGAGSTLWVAYSFPVSIVAQFDVGSSTVTPIAAGLVRDEGILEFGGIAADPDSGFVYVSDPIRNTIAKYAPSADGGRRVALLATAGTGDGFVQRPHGLYAFGDSLLVADTGKSWIQVLSADVPLSGRQVAGPSDALLDLRAPLDVWVDSNGYFYVADTGNNRVLQLGSAGDLREVVTETDPDAPALPISVAANPTQVWVPDPITGRLVVYQINTNIEELP
jgi:DNA-binding beta-propeller fold protein YncE